MEIINRSKFDIIASNKNNIWDTFDIVWLNPPLNLYLRINEDLILIKKVTEFCNKIIIRDSLIENEVEVEVMK